MTVGANHLVENVNERNENIFITRVTYTVTLQCKCFNYSNLYTKCLMTSCCRPQTTPRTPLNEIM